MGNRKLPFGYQMCMGEIVRRESEAEAVQEIFLQYALGASLKAIAGQMSKTGPAYDVGKSWNKNMVARILENTKYTGTEHYPKLVDIKMFNAVAEKRQAKQTLPERTPAQKALKRLCSKPATPEIEHQVIDLMSRLIEHPEQIKQTEKKPVATQAGTQRELDQVLNSQPLDEDRARRVLRNLGIAVMFEKENINSLPPDSEFLITMYGAMAQSESESISKNVTWGKQRAMERGQAFIPYSSLYAFEKGEDGKMKIIPEQAAIVRELYDRFLAGASYRMLQSWLEENHIPTVKGASIWSCTSIKSILTNEKYYGDVLMQKTFRQDVISKKMVKNTGQRTQYLIQGHHEGIVTKEKFDAVQAEIARRNARRSPAKQAVTGRGCYTSKYALSDRL